MEVKDIIVMNSTKLGNRDMDISRSTGFVNLKREEYSLPANFYGNQITNLAKTNFPGVYLCVDRHNKVFDILVKKDEISDLSASEIRDILDGKRIVYAKNMTKKSLLSLLGIDYTGDTDGFGEDPNNNN